MATGCKARESRRGEADQSYRRLQKILGGQSETVGRVRVETKPKGAKVTVGTQVVSKPTPVEFDLKPGGYQVTLEVEDYEPLQKTTEIEAGKRIQLVETLNKK